MALNLMSVSVGNLFTAAVNFLIADESNQVILVGADYFLFFAAAMATTAVLFVPVAVLYRERVFLQDEVPEGPPPAGG
jgi:POT family proton-dependent oligopeptide transporter